MIELFRQFLLVCIGFSSVYLHPRIFLRTLVSPSQTDQGWHKNECSEFACVMRRLFDCRVFGKTKLDYLLSQDIGLLTM